MQQGLLIACVVILTLILLAVIVGLGFVLRRLGRTAEAAEKALDELGREIGPTLQAAQAALRGVESLTAKSEEELDRVGSVLRSTDRIVSGAAVVEAAAKAMKGSRLTLSSVLTGIKEGLRVLKHTGDTKEG